MILPPPYSTRTYTLVPDTPLFRSLHANAASDPHVLTERTDTVTLLHDNKKVAARLNAVFEIAPDGKIKGWREYYDSGDMQRQIGVTADDWAAIIDRKSVV